MSSPTTGTGTGTAVMNHRTNHCNSCNTDLSTSNALRCPHCISHLPSNPNPNPNSSQLPIQSFIYPFTPSTTTTTDSSITSSDDNFRLDSPYLHRLIHHLRYSNDSSPSTTTPRHSPTSKCAIESIPTITITTSFLEIDPIVICAVCKDQFVVNDETKQLPCKHIYHPDCILPWLSQRNSCPVCRFQMPREQLGRRVRMVRRRSRSRVLGFGNLIEDDVDDEAMLGIGFSNLHEQHLQSENDPNVVNPFTHIGQTVDVNVLPDSEMENGAVNESWSGFHLSRMSSIGWIDVSDDGDVEMP